MFCILQKSASKKPMFFKIFIRPLFPISFYHIFWEEPPVADKSQVQFETNNNNIIDF